jgi:hypothetical protein
MCIFLKFSIEYQCHCGALVESQVGDPEDIEYQCQCGTLVESQVGDSEDIGLSPPSVI